MTRVLRYPATFMLLFILIYVVLRVEAGERARMLALLSMTSIAAAELALAAVRAIKRRSVRDSRLLSHLVLAVGAGTIGFALLEPVNNVLLGLGSLLLAATIIGQAFHRQEAAES